MRRSSPAVLALLLFLSFMDFSDIAFAGPGSVVIKTDGDIIVIPAGTITLTGSADEDANASGEPDILKETGLLRARNTVPVSGHPFASG